MLEYSYKNGVTILESNYGPLHVYLILQKGTGHF